MLRWLTAGESHGPALVGMIDGVPAGLKLQSKDFEAELHRRRQGAGRGARQAFEKDRLEILGGIRHGVTTGAPIALLIHNSEWPKWTDVMSADPVDPQALKIDAGTGDEREIARNRPLTRPRPGHADLPGAIKYQQQDARNILERASARETAARVALGTVAKAILEQSCGIKLVSHLRSLGAVTSQAAEPIPADAPALDASPVRCLDPQTEAEMLAHLDELKKAGDTCGGVVETLAYGVPIGLGSHVQHDRRLDAAIAAEIMSIQAVKAVEIGDGMEAARRPGSQAQDEIVRDADGNWQRVSNHAGGIEGGISNGQPIVVRAAVKPISTVPKALRSIDWATGEESRANHQRSDVCAAVPAAVICESVLALVLAGFLLERAGGDTISQIKANLERLNAGDDRA
ncbi:chorismate synthase [Boudabousia liubingyangii]|uniref:Chorismate synthase n=1 Tax=Boudabousia liubingyangii TaxID=1921764 RepID=A0A1Q5PNH3_9ACTO|nr:chorismate synthase [Boudabousia liubingyangii]OKL47678.1 chorismate synthase [Boudabousia liubingyangii]OKL49104.1 chorismate synthase [Boudabousia liubingyangii]